jgi:surface protein
MPNPIKYSTGSETLALKKGNFFIGTGDVGKGPSDVTGFYQGVDVPKPGYVVYQYNENLPGGLTYAVINSDVELIRFVNNLSQNNFTTLRESFSWFDSQDDKLLINYDYDPIVTDSLIYNLDTYSNMSYPFSGNTVKSNSINGGTASFVNGAKYSTSNGGCVKFDGTDDYLTTNISGTDFPNGVISINLWVRLNSTNTNRGIYQFSADGSGGTYPWNALSINTNNKFYLRLSSTEAITADTILNKYINLCITRSTSEWKMYINGELKGTYNQNQTTSTEPLLIGVGYNGRFNGDIAQFSLYTKELSSDEVLQNYNAKKSRFNFITEWDTRITGTSSSNSYQIKLPLISSGNYSMTVDWGDGNIDTITSYNQNEITHTYLEQGIYTVTINGRCRGWGFNNYPDRNKLLDVKQWGCLEIINTHSFSGSRNLKISANDSPYITTCSHMFNNAKVNEMNIGRWDTSEVISFGNFLGLASPTFNSHVNDFDMSKVTDISSMFRWQYGFNQPLNNWNTSNISNFSGMFDRVSFNQPLSNWDTKKATSMFAMFINNPIFNQDVSHFITSGCTNMYYIFYNCSQFNQDISSWDVSKVTTWGQGFRGASKFNQNIGNWVMSAVTDMEYMFDGATNFNNGDDPSISGWTTSNVDDMQWMFRNTKFNQPIGSWDTKKVITMERMFENCSFNQDISNWIITGVTNFNNFMSGKSPSNYNYEYYDNLLNSWSQQNVKTGLTLSMGTIKYSSAGVSGRNTLVNTYGWTITDGGPL